MVSAKWSLNTSEMFYIDKVISSGDLCSDSGQLVKLTSSSLKDKAPRVLFTI